MVSREDGRHQKGVSFEMRGNRKGLLKGASVLALGLLTLVPATTVNAQIWGNDTRRERRQERREERREERQERREERREERQERREARRGWDWGNNGSWGGSYQLRQTALNAGYNEGIEEGRRDRNRRERFSYTDESDYRSATEDYSSRLGSRSLYQRYFRQGFENGYRDGWNGY